MLSDQRADDVPHDRSICHDGTDHPMPVRLLVGWACPVCEAFYPYQGPGTVERHNDGPGAGGSMDE